MLKQRLLTAAILLPLFVAALFFLDPLWFTVLLLLVLMLGFHEWAVLSAIANTGLRLAYIAAGIAVAVILVLTEQHGFLETPFFILVAGVWVIIMFWLIRYNASESADAGARGNGQYAWLVGFFVLIPAVMGMRILKQEDASDPQLLLVFFLIIWSADTGAYLAGRKWGQHKLAPRISPGKTIEGVAGGVVAALVVGLLAGLLLWELPVQLLLLWLLSVIAISLLSVVGDLFESIYKRRADVKDSGNILPGHGGVLDRIDSTCAALPLYMIVLYQLELIGAGNVVP